MAVKNATKNRADSDDVAIRHTELLQKLSDATAKQNWWEAMLNEPPVREMLDDFEKTIEDCRHELEDAKGDEVKRLQADIRARRTLRRKIEARASMRDVDAARKELREFEELNALFIEIETATGQ